MKRLARIFLYTLLSVAFFACGKEEQLFIKILMLAI